MISFNIDNGKKIFLETEIGPSEKDTKTKASDTLVPEHSIKNSELVRRTHLGTTASNGFLIKNQLEHGKMTKIRNEAKRSSIYSRITVMKCFLKQTFKTESSSTKNCKISQQSAEKPVKNFNLKFFKSKKPTEKCYDSLSEHENKVNKMGKINHGIAETLKRRNELEIDEQFDQKSPGQNKRKKSKISKIIKKITEKKDYENEYLKNTIVKKTRRNESRKSGDALMNKLIKEKKIFIPETPGEEENIPESEQKLISEYPKNTTIQETHKRDNMKDRDALTEEMSKNDRKFLGDEKSLEENRNNNDQKQQKKRKNKKTNKHVLINIKKMFTKLKLGEKKKQEISFTDCFELSTSSDLFINIEKELENTTIRKKSSNNEKHKEKPLKRDKKRIEKIFNKKSTTDQRSVELKNNKEESECKNAEKETNTTTELKDKRESETNRNDNGKQEDGYKKAINKKLKNYKIIENFNLEEIKPLMPNNDNIHDASITDIGPANDSVNSRNTEEREDRCNNQPRRELTRRKSNKKGRSKRKADKKLEQKDSYNETSSEKVSESNEIADPKNKNKKEKGVQAKKKERRIEEAEYEDGPNNCEGKKLEKEKLINELISRKEEELEILIDMNRLKRKLSNLNAEIKEEMKRKKEIKTPVTGKAKNDSKKLNEDAIIDLSQITEKNIRKTRKNVERITKQIEKELIEKNGKNKKADIDPAEMGFRKTIIMTMYLIDVRNNEKKEDETSEWLTKARALMFKRLCLINGVKGLVTPESKPNGESKELKKLTNPIRGNEVL